MEINSPPFMGVYSADQVPYERAARLASFSFIVNLSAAGEPGTHFVAVIGTPTKVEYADSLALPLNFIYDLRHGIEDIMAISNRRLTLTHRFPIQSASSLFCGLHAMLAIMLADRSRFPRRPPGGKMANFLIGMDYSRQTEAEMREVERHNQRVCLAKIEWLLKHN